MAGLCGKLVIDYRQKQRAAAIGAELREMFKVSPEDAARLEARLAAELAEEHRQLDAAEKKLQR